METLHSSSSSPNDVRHFGKRKSGDTGTNNVLCVGGRAAGDFGSAPRSPEWPGNGYTSKHPYEATTGSDYASSYESVRDGNSKLRETTKTEIIKSTGSAEARLYEQSRNANSQQNHSPIFSARSNKTHDISVGQRNEQNKSVGRTIYEQTNHGYQRGGSNERNNYAMPPAQIMLETEQSSLKTAGGTESGRMYTPPRVSPAGPPPIIMTTASHGQYPLHPMSMQSYSYGQFPPSFVQYPYYPPPGPHFMLPPQPQRDYIRDINQNDVLCGRGGATNSHPGNRYYRSIVKRFQDRYLHAKKRDKPEVAALVVEEIRQKGGRFLKREQCVANGEILWYDIGLRGALEKTCQACREGAPALKRKRRREERIDRDLKRTETDDTVSVSSSLGRPRPAVANKASADDQKSTRTSRHHFSHGTEDFQAVSLAYRGPSDRGARGYPHPMTSTTLLPDSKFDVTELSHEDRDLYNRDFLPPDLDAASPRRRFVSITPNAHFSPAPSFSDDDSQEELATRAVAV